MKEKKELEDRLDNVQNQLSGNPSKKQPNKRDEARAHEGVTGTLISTLFQLLLLSLIFSYFLIFSTERDKLKKNEYRK